MFISDIFPTCNKNKKKQKCQGICNAWAFCLLWSIKWDRIDGTRSELIRRMGIANLSKSIRVSKHLFIYLSFCPLIYLFICSLIDWLIYLRIENTKTGRKFISSKSPKINGKTKHHNYKKSSKSVEAGRGIPPPVQKYSEVLHLK